MMPRKKSRHINFQKLYKADKNNNSNSLYYSCHKNLNCMLKLSLLWKEYLLRLEYHQMVKMKITASIDQSFESFFPSFQLFRERYCKPYMGYYQSSGRIGIKIYELYRYWIIWCPTLRWSFNLWMTGRDGLKSR